MYLGNFLKTESKLESFESFGFSSFIKFSSSYKASLTLPPFKDLQVL